MRRTEAVEFVMALTFRGRKPAERGMAAPLRFAIPPPSALRPTATNSQPGEPDVGATRASLASASTS